MAFNVPTLTRRFEREFNKKQASILAESITEAYSDLVKTSDFNELKGIVRELAVAQQRTESRVDKLAIAQQEMAVAQQEMAVALQETAVNMSKMSQAISGLGNEVGGLSRTMSYALENEAYRALPTYLERELNITVKSRFVRTEIEGEEIDFFAQGEQNGHSVCLVGESKLRIDERRRRGHELDRVLEQLDKKAAAVQKTYPDCGIVRLLVTHYVRPSVRKQLEAEGVLVILSFEWG